MPWSMPIWREQRARPGARPPRSRQSTSEASSSRRAGASMRRSVRRPASSTGARTRPSSQRASRARLAPGLLDAGLHLPRDAGERQAAGRGSAELRWRRPAPPLRAPCPSLRRRPRSSSSGRLRSSSRASAQVGSSIASRDCWRSTSSLVASPRCPRARRVLGSALGEDLGVARLGGEQLGVRALGDDPAVLDDRDPVGEADGRQAVGDDQRRPALHQRRAARRGSAARSARRSPTSRRRARGSAGSTSSVRAIAIRWRCPPESVKPRSPTTVS